MKKVFLVIIFIFLCSPAWATDWYVHDTGGGNGDGSIGSPWEDFSNIVWGGAGVVAGDTLYVLGTVTGQKLTIGASGTDDSTRITIRGDSPGNAGIIDANAVVNTCITVNRDYITITNITLQGTSGTASYNLFNNTSATGLIIDNVESKNGGWGGGLTVVTDLIVRDSSFHDNTESGLLVKSASSPLIQRSSFYNNASGTENREGLFIGGGSGVSNFVVEYCSAYNQSSNGSDGSGFDFSATAGEPNSGTFRYNISYNNGGHGFKGSGGDNTDQIVYWIYNIMYDNGGGNSHQNFIIYETVTAHIYNNVIGDTGVGALAAIRFEHGSGSKIIYFKNNIVYGSYPYVFIFNELYTTLTAEYNIYGAGTTAFAKNNNGGGNISFATWQGTYGYDGTGSSVDNPDFTDQAGDDYTLQSTSPAIDTGVNLGASYDDAIMPTSDLAPNTVTTGLQGSYGSGWEIGAFIYNAATPTIDGIIISDAGP